MVREPSEESNAGPDFRLDRISASVTPCFDVANDSQHRRSHRRAHVRVAGIMTETEFRVVSRKGADRKIWQRAWETCEKEPFAHPDYVELFTSKGEEALCAITRSATGLALLPFILRPILCDGWKTETSLRDATSPYGYGGPYGHGDPAWGDLWVGFTEWMTRNNVVSMFGRLALGSATLTHLPPRACVRSDSDNVIVDLTRSSAEQWLHYEHKVRKNVKKAIRANLRVEIKQSFTDIEEFSQLYDSTMARRAAPSWYYFGVDFFTSLTERLSGSYIAAEVRDETNRLVSAELVLCSDRYLYSFLGGTRGDAFPHAPNDLLKHVVIDYGRDSGRVGYILGGGYAKDDGIFRYKKSFDPTGYIPFHRLELIADQTAYDSLITERLRHERTAASGARLEDGFFPSYRGQVVLDDQEAAR
jgi:hypothetical protein